MAKNDPRSQIPAPVVTPPSPSHGVTAQDQEAALAVRLPSNGQENLRAPAITELAARAITNGAAMAREYAAAAGELCRTADTHPQGRANARRLLRLALAHLET